MAPEIAVLELQVTLNGHQFLSFWGLRGGIFADQVCCLLAGLGILSCLAASANKFLTYPKLLAGRYLFSTKAGST
jgi:hypothetical protein